MKNKSTQGITVGGKDLQEYLYEKEVEEKTKNIHQMYNDETKTIPMGTPRGTKINYKPRASRASKVKHIKPIRGRYMDLTTYETRQQKVIAVLKRIEDVGIPFREIADYIAGEDKNVRKSLSPVIGRIKTALTPHGFVAIQEGGTGIIHYGLGTALEHKTVEEIDKIIKDYWRGRKANKAKAPTSKPSTKSSNPEDYIGKAAPVQTHVKAFEEKLQDAVSKALWVVPKGMVIKFTIEITGGDEDE